MKFDYSGFKKVLPQLKIKPKTGGLVDFVPNRHQSEFYDRVENNRYAGKPTREIHVKDRQVGDTTGIAAFNYADANANPAVEALVVVNAARTLTKVWRIYDRFIKYHAYDEGLEENEDEGKRKPRYHSQNHWTHEDNDSSISIELASDESSRGGSALHLHASEVDFWDDFDDTFEAIMAQVPDVPASVAVLETTFDGGRSAEFRDFVIKALNGENEWEVIFIGWLEHEEYTRPFKTQRERQKFLETLDHEEQEIIEKFDPPLEKLNWRRHTIRNKFRGESIRFKRSFPIDVYEALRFKGDGYFSAQAVDHYLGSTRSPVRELVPDFDPVTGSWVMLDAMQLGYLPAEHDDAEPRMFVWEEPKAGARYVIGADVADSQDNVQYGNAKSVAIVLDADTGELVARWSGKIEPTRFGDIIRSMGYYYNKALLIPERNNMGQVVIQRLIDKAYPRVYSAEKLGFLPDGQVKISNKLGFDTTPKTRPVLLRKLQEMVNGMRMDLPDSFLIEQMTGFVDKRGAGQPRRKYKGEDDAIIALALAVWASTHRERWARRAGPDAYIALEQKQREEEANRRATNPTIDELKARIRRTERKRNPRLSSMFGGAGRRSMKHG